MGFIPTGTAGFGAEPHNKGVIKLQTPKWNFDNSYTKLPALFFTKQKPDPVDIRQLVVFNYKLAEKLQAPLDLQTFAGNHIPDGAEPLAQAYAGHQFGYFNMLGDGRAVLLGEQITPDGERFDIQLKGSGRTPYSRGGDGRAALGPMLREYIISEAMHALRIPTTRSLAVVETKENVIREKAHPGAVLTRVASSHIRVGTFEYALRFGGAENVKILADYTIARHFPNAKTYLELLQEVVTRQAALIAKWLLVGFIHGVMNTDNMAISGETIDYGPCAFMDMYNPSTVFSSIDTQGRYAYKNQPKMAMWNLTRFAETLLPLLHSDENTAIELAQAEIENFQPSYKKNWLVGMRAKLGLSDEKTDDELLITDILQLMQQLELDYTNTFRALTLGLPVHEFDAGFRQWHERWQTRISHQTKSETLERMKMHNPCIIPRNHNVEEALAAAEAGDISIMEKLLRALEAPYAYIPEQEAYTQPPPEKFCNYKTFCGT